MDSIRIQEISHQKYCALGVGLLVPAYDKWWYLVETHPQWVFLLSINYLYNLGRFFSFVFNFLAKQLSIMCISTKLEGCCAIWIKDDLLCIMLDDLLAIMLWNPKLEWAMNIMAWQFPSLDFSFYKQCFVCTIWHNTTVTHNNWSNKLNEHIVAVAMCIFTYNTCLTHQTVVEVSVLPKLHKILFYPL